MLFSLDPVTVEVPGEPGNSFDFLKVPWPAFRMAARIASRENNEDIAPFASSFIQSIQEGDKDKKKKLEDASKKGQFDESNFDTETLFEAGFAGWSGPNYDGVPCDKENRARLSMETMKWAKKTLIELTRPPSEEEEKN